MSNGEYDLIVIGGGINGAAIANLASSKGLKVALLEKNDFASGTSSKSTKLIHGGLRYLENFHFSLVREALRERSIQVKKAPHLVKPLEFIVPVYKEAKRPLWLIRLGVTLYDILSGASTLGRRQYLSNKKILQNVPGLKQENLIGGVSYFDAQMDDARLCLENVMQADAQGAHVANYIEVRELIKENGRCVGVRTYDHIDGRYCTIKAKNIIAAVGPWTNEFMRKEKNQSPGQIRPTKGVHLVYAGRFSKKAILVFNEDDGRVFFIIPWGENTLIGTTDTDYKKGADDVSVNDEDIGYLLEATRRVFPNRSIDPSNIIDTFAGLRPLIKDEGSPSKVSRECVINQSFSGIYYILGGKYTTYRKIAEDCLKKIYSNKFRFSQKEFCVYGGGRITESVAAVSKKFSVAEDIVERIMAVYGSRYEDVLKIVTDGPKYKKRLTTNTDIIQAQIIYAQEKEMAQTKEDIYYRRLGMRYLVKDAKAMIKEIEQVIINRSH